ncbi:helix-turn-helix transcriptional regulator [Alkalilimnicola sp. S0819]|uniref:helix-turn-helix transcriptional regulator n=1 Tax=Alkalilimnicola sp. S0819 TaxID=2613922 RepID=UPI0012619C14|nr:WYL domain-containing protein [Alkalilimnicola sp. S0819]KAB7624016.1 WYL domain-containing protein [Alkalilimnicola sp. S0819]MPQ16624.1 WYL domain-containing protein [Alkalilimnicola sp. S0819]
MHTFDQVCALDRLLRQSRRPVSRQRIEEELECSRATTVRVIGKMRDYLRAPIEYDRDQNGYYYSDEAFELPGFWFRADELAALLVMLDALDTLEEGVLDGTLDALRERLVELSRNHGQDSVELRRRVRVLRIGGRDPGTAFRPVADALLGRRRLRLVYRNRGDGQEKTRTVSPQRLVRYRDNWYLDAWCHRAAGLRSFAVERIAAPERLDETALDVPEEELERCLSSSYGIFSGEPTATAVIDFTPARARWVAEERWHPDQRAEWLPDGRYRLYLPYHHPDELLMDVLRYGADAEVVAPAHLRSAVAASLTAALEHYQRAGSASESVPDV